MTVALACNIGAWIMCGVVAILLFGDFIKTERALAKEKKEQGDIGNEQ